MIINPHKSINSNNESNRIFKNHKVMFHSPNLKLLKKQKKDNTNWDLTFTSTPFKTYKK